MVQKYCGSDPNTVKRKQAALWDIQDVKNENRTTNVVKHGGVIFKNVTFEVTFEPADQGLPGRCIGASWSKLCRTLALRSKFGHPFFRGTTCHWDGNLKGQLCALSTPKVAY